MHQVGFTQSHATINEQWIKRAAGILANLNSRRTSQLVAFFTLDEPFECMVGIEFSTNNRACGFRLYRCSTEPWLRRFSCLACPNLYGNCKARCSFIVISQLGNLFNAVSIDPVNDKMIWGEQAQRQRIFDRLQRTNPGVKLLLG